VETHTSKHNVNDPHLSDLNRHVKKPVDDSLRVVPKNQ